MYVKQFGRRYGGPILSGWGFNVAALLVMLFWGISPERESKPIHLSLADASERMVLPTFELEMVEPPLIDEEVDQLVETEDLSQTDLPEPELAEPEPIVSEVVLVDIHVDTSESTVDMKSPAIPVERRLDGGTLPSDSGQEGLKLGRGGPSNGYGNGQGGYPEGNGYSFFGVPARGDVVFLLDCSGSMNDFHSRKEGIRKDLLLREVSKVVDSLNEDTNFQIIFFEHVLQEFPDNDLKPATQGNKEKVFEWMHTEVHFRGSEDPVKAALRAFEIDPDVIFLLTDGEFGRNEKVVREITSSNVNRVPIMTIGLGGKDSYKALQPLASYNGGIFRFIGK